MKIVALAPLLLLAACAPGHRDLSKDVVKKDRCVAARVHNVIGKPGTPRLADKARIAAGAILVRFLHPDEMVTMEYQEGRLNIQLDAEGKVTGLRCG